MAAAAAGARTIPTKVPPEKRRRKIRQLFDLCDLDGVFISPPPTKYYRYNTLPFALIRIAIWLIGFRLGKRRRVRSRKGFLELVIQLLVEFVFALLCLFGGLCVWHWVSSFNKEPPTLRISSTALLQRHQPYSTSAAHDASLASLTDRVSCFRYCRLDIRFGASRASSDRAMRTCEHHRRW